ncbi:DNA topoisomerase IV subunit A [Flaviflexus salsibiostraticola]|uniref:DNA topoisomerase (ATP-hydrolyzing) n=1 Tax=Flaviflexus salsibiostraticola TaxID=1282737 RepID=A0A3S8Z6M4_9ACTO|nr:DNA topoisomerase IV subunit A [Flaviflexus salsibiostraticola]AZN29098.1 DNA topoisomerase IV subunit A [Flaviflexus salsibiostraticola]
MAPTRNTPPHEAIAENIVDIDVSEEMKGSFLEYAYSVIYSRALPDARDGLKPVQRRILYQMGEMGLRPERGYVKSSRVVGEVMGKLHPHGDSAIYETMVRLAQPFVQRLPLIDGHGNFGSLDDGPAASRYTEVRLTTAALAMTKDLDEDTVDMVPNYDNSYMQPEVLPAAIPSLLVNGAAGIAVGMATNMPPHNLGEVVAGARHLLAHPDATLEDIMRFIPGPDLPEGGKIVGLTGIRDAYENGRGLFRTRATTRIENVTARKKAIVVTELPYQIGAEKVIEKIKAAVQAKKIEGITAVQNLTDRHHGLRLVIELKNTVNPDAVLAKLFKLTPMEETFGINNVALVEGKPQTLGLLPLLRVFVDHRIDVTRRRSAFRLGRAKDRLHLVEGLLIAILDIDEVIAVIRSSDDTAAARDRLMSVFDLSEVQADYILELRLRRLTKFSRLELEAERDELLTAIAELEEILASEERLHQLVSSELADVATQFATPRRTILLESDGKEQTPVGDVEVNDEPCHVLLSATGLVARSAEPPGRDSRQSHDAIASAVRATTRSQIGVVTASGEVHRLEVVDTPALPPGSASLAGGVPLRELIPAGADPIGLISLEEDADPIAVATALGRVKRVTPTHPKMDSWSIITLTEGDTVVGVGHASDDTQMVLISSDAYLLRFNAGLVRPQGRTGQGVAGIKLAESTVVRALGIVAEDHVSEAEVVTITGSFDALPGTQTGSVKVTPLDRFPVKGRATLGVRCHRFLRGEDMLALAWVGIGPRAVGAGGQPIDLPETNEKRDASGTMLTAIIGGIG